MVDYMENSTLSDELAQEAGLLFGDRLRSLNASARITAKTMLGSSHD
jgi:hypothetical protein